MINPFKFLRNKKIDPVELEKAVDKLFDLADESKFQKPFDSMQDKFRREGMLLPPDDVKIDSEITRNETFFKQTYVTASWTPVKNALRYIAQLNYENDYRNAIRESFTSKVQWEGIPGGTNVKIRVKSVDDNGIESEWSKWTEHFISVGKYQGIAPSGLTVTKFGKWVICAVDRINRRKKRDHLGYEWHSARDDELDANSDFTVDAEEERLNIVANPGFENNDGTDVLSWTDNGTLGSGSYYTAQKRSGDSCCRIDADDANDGKYQTVTLDTDSYYIIEGYCRSVTGTVYNVRMSLDNIGAGAFVSPWDTIFVKKFVNTRWKKFKIKVLTNSAFTTVELTLRFQGSNTGDVLWDDIRVHKINGTFEKYTFGSHCVFHVEDYDQTFVKVRAIDVNGNYSTFTDATASESAFGLAGLVSQPNKCVIDSTSVGGNPIYFTRLGYARINWTNPSTLENGDPFVDGDEMGYMIYWCDTTDYSTGADSENWHSRFIPARKVTFSSANALVRGLIRGQSYRFAVTVFGAMVGKNAESDKSDAVDAVTIDESVAPTALTSANFKDYFAFTSDETYRGADESFIGTRAFHTLGILTSALSEVAWVHVRWRRTAGSAANLWLHHKTFAVQGLDIHNTYTLIRINGLGDNVEYEFDANLIGYNLAASGYATNTVTLTSLDLAVYDWTGMVNYLSACTPMRTFWFKNTSFRLNIEFDIPNTYAFARRWQFLVARNNVIIKQDWLADSIDSNPTHIETFIPLGWVPFATFQDGQPSAFKVNVRPWLNLKPGDPLFSTTGNWRTPANWSLTPSGFSASVPFANATDEDGSAPAAPVPTQNWWRFVEIQPVEDGYDFPSNFLYWSVHALGETNVPLTTDDGLTTLQSFNAQRKSRILWGVITHHSPRIAFVPPRVLVDITNAVGKKREFRPLDDVVFRTIIHGYKSVGAGEMAIGHLHGASYNEATGMDAAEDDSFVFDITGETNFTKMDSVGVYAGDLLLTKSVRVVLQLGGGAGDTTIRVDNSGGVLVNGDLFMIGKTGRKVSAATEVLRVNDGSIGTGKREAVIFERGYNSTTRETADYNDLLIKIGTINGDAIHRFMYFNSTTDSLQVIRTDNGSGWSTLTNFFELQAEFGSSTDAKKAVNVPRGDIVFANSVTAGAASKIIWGPTTSIRAQMYHVSTISPVREDFYFDVQNGVLHITTSGAANLGELLIQAQGAAAAVNIICPGDGVLTLRPASTTGTSVCYIGTNAVEFDTIELNSANGVVIYGDRDTADFPYIVTSAATGSRMYGGTNFYIKAAAAECLMIAGATYPYVNVIATGASMTMSVNNFITVSATGISISALDTGDDININAHGTVTIANNSTYPLVSVQAALVGIFDAADKYVRVASGNVNILCDALTINGGTGANTTGSETISELTIIDGIITGYVN